MPAPEFKFTDSPSGLPPNPVPVRLACLVSEWSPYLLASILGQLERFTSLKAYQFNANSDKINEVPPSVYNDLHSEIKNLCADAGNRHSPDYLELLPVDHFVWSDDLVLAYSDYIDECVGREDAYETCDFNWWPSFENRVSEQKAIEACPDLSQHVRGVGVTNLIRRIGEVWTIQYNGHRIHISHKIGLAYISHLLMAPGKEFTVWDLHIKTNLPPTTTETTIHDLFDHEEIDDGISIDGLGDAGDAIDKQAIREIKAKLLDLDEQIDDARKNSAAEQQCALEIERGKILAYYKTNTGKKGRSRVDGSTNEKIRKSIYKAIKDVISHTLKSHSEFGEHLEKSITTGNSCSYKPATATKWQA